MEGLVVAGASTALWAIAIGLMVTATLWYGGPLVLAGWALLTALWACIWTVWALLMKERHRVETICRLVLDDPEEDTLRSV